MDVRSIENLAYPITEGLFRTMVMKTSREMELHYTVFGLSAMEIYRVVGSKGETSWAM